jgi:hypothetical protein
MYRTATSYKHRINLGAEAVGVNRLEQFFIGWKRVTMNRFGAMLARC